MAPLPDLRDEAVFPTFMALPEAPADADSSSLSLAQPRAGADSDCGGDGGDEQPWYLLAQIKNDMTITKPTLVLHDRAGSPFALVFEGLGREGVDLRGKGLKKGATAVVPRALRTTPTNEAKRPFVRVPAYLADSVRALPGPLERVLQLGDGGDGGGDGEDLCAGCGKVGAAASRCTGCGRVRYCGKECQLKAWNDGHKTDCKIYKAVDAVFAS